MAIDKVRCPLFRSSLLRSFGANRRNVLIQAGCQGRRLWGCSMDVEFLGKFFALFGWFWFCPHLVLIVGGLLPFWRILKKQPAAWFEWEAVFMVLPYALWAILIPSGCRSKTFANFFVESAIIAATVLLATFVRTWLGNRSAIRFVAAKALVVTCAVAFALWGFFPYLETGPL
jgi:hypothetical protein